MVITGQKLAFTAIEAGNCYVDCDFDYSSERIYITDVTFDHCTFAQQNFADSEWLDVTFKNIDFSNDTFESSVIYRTTFDNCRMMGSELIASRLKAVKFSNSQLMYSNFNSAKIEHGEFKECNLTESSFQSVTFKDINYFQNSNLNESDFADSHLRGVDLSTSDFDELLLDPNMVQGLVLNSYQVQQIAGLLGIILK